MVGLGVSQDCCLFFRCSRPVSLHLLVLLGSLCADSRILVCRPCGSHRLWASFQVPDFVVLYNHFYSFVAFSFCFVTGCRVGWSGAQCVDQAGLKTTELHLHLNARVKGVGCHWASLVPFCGRSSSLIPSHDDACSSPSSSASQTWGASAQHSGLGSFLFPFSKLSH